ncbi:hypothetical protein Ahy_B03g063574 [Arachis hypogaea]|uniref:Uncharacterized protein n=1 Tax=Arachis hypogaea TaxID=3818 RepID=A0A444ZXP1_ARAHY|nr:hypothetical protein Ahy_B03g063574 [Arachis hypogaea]
MDLLKLPHSSRARKEGGEARPLFVPPPFTSRCRRVASQSSWCCRPQPSPLPYRVSLEHTLSPLPDINKSWISKPRDGLEYRDGLNRFLDFAFANASFDG